MEIATKIYGNGDYIIGSDGSVYSVKSKKYLKPLDNGSGYKSVCFCVDGKVKRQYIHRVVAELFVPNPHGFPEINHLDENRSNNHADNLEWCTSRYNKNYGQRAERFGVNRGKPVLCVETGAKYYSVGEAERQTGIKRGDIWSCCSGYRNAKTAGGYHWEYVSTQ